MSSVQQIGRVDATVGIDLARHRHGVGRRGHRIGTVEDQPAVALEPEIGRAAGGDQTGRRRGGRAGAIVAQQYLPERLKDRRYYEPTAYGAEKTIAERLAWWARRLKQ